MTGVKKAKECLKSNEHDLHKEKALYSETVFKALDKCNSRKNYKIWENPKLDIISCTMEYLKKAKIIRTEKKKLFVSFIQPHKAVKSCTIEKWLKIIWHCQ